jgi:hypothetical protein
VRTSRATAPLQQKDPVPSTTPGARPSTALGASRPVGGGQTGATADAVGSVEGVLKLLARAIRQFHTYPATSPICIEAITACHDALMALSHRDRLSFRITPHDLIVDETTIGAGSVIEHELTRRLFRARVANLDVDRAATPRDMSRFCIDLVAADDLEREGITFAERLTEHGVTGITVGMAHRPAVLDLGNPAPATQDVLTHERRRRETLTQKNAPVSYLYPPDKGWVRLDPGQSLDSVSLVDLVVLVEDPADIASMLLRLTDDDIPGVDTRQTALERKFSDVTLLFSALDPRLAQVMFGRLARAVLKLDPDRRNNLLQRTVLPGLLDGRDEGRVLRDFPDMDLAESVCLLLDLETAAPEVLSAALNRLDLTPDRRAAIEPLIDERLRAQRGGEPLDRSSGIERHAQGLIRVDTARDNDFSEFAAFDLSVDEQSVAVITAVRQGILETDTLMTQLRTVAQLVRLEPNPTLVDAFLRRGLELMLGLEQAERWQDLIAEIKGYTAMADELRERRPDVSETILKALSDFCTPSRLLALAGLHDRDDQGRAIVEDLTRALGPALVPGFVALIDRAAHQVKARAFTPLMCELAPVVAEALLAELDSCGVAAARVIVKVVGHAGHGHEAAVARLVQHTDAQIVREAIRALARMGTPSAAVHVARQLREGSEDRRAAAEDALWHFPPAPLATQLRELLRSREFVFKHPQLAARLIERAGQAKVQGLADVLKSLEPLRFRFWKPSLVHVAMKAREARGK